MFKSYWDFEEKERAAFTEEDVNRLLDAELMINGVIKPPACPRRRTAKDVQIAKKVYHQVQIGEHGHVIEVAFDSIEAAEAFVALNPKLVARDWQLDTHFVKPVIDVKITATAYAEEADVNAAQDELRKIKAEADDYSRAKSEYDQATAKVDKVTRGVWADWHDKRAVSERMKKISTTHAHYLELTKGDRDLAMIFLRKAFDAETIKSAALWTDDVDLLHEPAAGTAPVARQLDPTTGDDIAF